MSDSWEEVLVARRENRRELVLTGPDISERIEHGGLDETVFKLNGLNFLEISKTCISNLSPKLCNLVNLTNLVLHGNKLSSIPETIGGLTKLKFLDLSRNELQNLPPEIGQLEKLHTLNINCNQLTETPDFSTLHQLHILDISHNRLLGLPAGITNPKLELLAQILANSNELQEIPADLCELAALKTLDISENQLTIIPPEIGDCQKLKEFKYGGNQLKDRRFARMIDGCSTKAILDYQRAILDKERKSAGGGGKGKKKKKGKGRTNDEIDDDLSKNFMKVLHFGEEKGLGITVADTVMEVRQYLVCCIVKHLNMNRSKNMFKRFLTFQTKLHDTSCRKRQVATIATHDLKAVNSPVSYEARAPKVMNLTPLGKLKETTADKLVGRLKKEADDFRKEKKRSTLSGIHQYLDLLEGQQFYPCMVDSKGTIISFPPITNCDATKISRDTTDILVEVTSSTSLDVCKKVMGELLQGMLEMGLGCEEAPEPANGEEAAAGSDLHMTLTSDQVLVLEQVKVVDSRNVLRVVYPSRIDLQCDAFRVDRD